jgi:hypothetical protein
LTQLRGWGIVILTSGRKEPEMLYHTFVVDPEGLVITSDDGRYGAMKMPAGDWVVRFPGARGTERASNVFMADALIGLCLDREEVK